MKHIIDLHIHSTYSRGTSPQMTLENLYRWGKIKGIEILATGDFTHPQWFLEIKKKLEPAETGLFKLKNKLARKEDKTLPEIIRKKQMRFILSAEISNIYSKNEKVRKMHNVILAPSLKSISKFNTELKKIGNLNADGRPILGLDSQKMLKIMLDTDPQMFFIPAHIWTPWFSLFGSKSGFDTLEEAFEELTPYIKAVETGLSSDPFMNWRLDDLQNLTIVSNSDAHSLYKLGREANVLNCELSYKDIINTLNTNDRRMLGTIEFFPQEGKYHFDGHRNCNVCFTPEETKKNKRLCPKCQKPLVVGVDYRVNELANHGEKYRPKRHKKVEYIIPLMEILAEIKGVKSISAKSVLSEYEKIYSKIGDEFSVLRSISIKSIKDAGFPQLAEAIKRLRQNKIYISPGYDGVYGIIKVFKDQEEIKNISGQESLF